MEDKRWFPTADCVAANILRCTRESCEDFQNTRSMIPKIYEVMPYLLNDPSSPCVDWEDVRLTYNVFLEALTLPGVAEALRIADKYQYIAKLSCSVQTGIALADIPEIKRSRAAFLDELVDFQLITSLKVLLMRKSERRGDPVDNIIPFNLQRSL